MVRCIKPDPRAAQGLHDRRPRLRHRRLPRRRLRVAQGRDQAARFDRDTAKRIRTKTYFGQELVARPRRLALMNLYLHQVEPHITLGDSIYEAPTSQRFDVDPHQPAVRHQGRQPGARPRRLRRRDQQQAAQLPPARPDASSSPVAAPRSSCPTTCSSPTRPARSSRSSWRTATSTPSCAARAAPSAPTPRAPRPTSSSSPRVEPTKRTWIYDARANVPKITKKSSAAHRRALRRVRAAATATTPTARPSAPRATRPTAAGAASASTRSRSAHYKLDGFKWLRDEELDDPDEILDPAELVTDAIAELQAAVTELHELQKLLDDAEIAA